MYAIQDPKLYTLQSSQNASKSIERRNVLNIRIWCDSSWSYLSSRADPTWRTASTVPGHKPDFQNNDNLIKQILEKFGKRFFYPKITTVRHNQQIRRHDPPPAGPWTKYQYPSSAHMRQSEKIKNCGLTRLRDISETTLNYVLIRLDGKFEIT